MLADSGAALLLAGDLDTSKLLFSGVVARISDVLAQSDVEAPARPGAAELAYVMYTSGSSGQPKGVMGTHAGIVNRLQWMWREFPFDVEDRCAHTASFGFVDSIWMTFGPCRGVPLVMLASDEVRDVHQLVNAIAAHRITRLVVVPGLLGMMAASPVTETAARLDHVRLCVCSGDVLPVSLVTAAREVLRKATLLNVYGSTEVAADATFFAMAPGEAAPDTCRVPIGKPLDNFCVAILGQDSVEPVAAGAVGEICIAGAGVALGYWGRAELTRSRFVAAGAQGTERSTEPGTWGGGGRTEISSSWAHGQPSQGARVPRRVGRGGGGVAAARRHRRRGSACAACWATATACSRRCWWSGRARRRRQP
jgi:non-ribosomal peptide synthetase component F